MLKVTTITQFPNLSYVSIEYRTQTIDLMG